MSEESWHESEASCYESASETSSTHRLDDATGQHTSEDYEMGQPSLPSPDMIWSRSLSPSQVSASEDPCSADEMSMDDAPTAGSPMLQQETTLLPTTTSKSQRLLDLFEDVVTEFEKERITFADWLILIFEPKRGRSNQDSRLKSFWQHTDQVCVLLNSWVHAHQTKIGQKTVSNWAISYVGSRMRSESLKITRNGTLRSSDKQIGPNFLKGFKISDIKETIQTHCPTSVKVFLSMAGAGNSKTLSEAPTSAQNIVFICILMILREFSQRNNLVQILFSLFMYAAGLQRQGFEVLAHVGLLVSYTFLVNGIGAWVSRRRHKRGQTKNRNTPPKRPAGPGPLKTLETTSIKEVRELTQTGKPIGFIFDNVDVADKKAEPVLGKHDTLINGTCATMFELFGATEEALDQASAHAAFMSAGPLEREDIILSPEERSLHHQLMIYNILRMIVCHGGQHFAQYMPILEATQPATQHLIPLHQSQTYPLPAMEINESSIDGAIDVMNGVYASAGVNTSDKVFQRRRQFVGGDYKSIYNLRKGKECRAGHEGPETSFINLVFIIGLFHLLMTAVTGFLILHFGELAGGIQNAGSLHYHNRLLERKPIAINSPIHYTQARNLISVSLIARVLHCLTLVASCASIDEYTKSLLTLDHGQRCAIYDRSNLHLPPSWNKLVEDATKIFDRYASTRTVEDLRTARRLANRDEAAGDMVYENALLFMRDMLNLQEIHSAVKRGDSGRIVLHQQTASGSGRALRAPRASRTKDLMVRALPERSKIG